MQATTCCHESVTYPILQKTDFILHDPVTFHPTNRVFNADSDGGNTTIRGLLRGGEVSSRRFFLGLDDHDVLQTESLEALLLIQTAAKGQGIPSQLCQALIRGVAFTGVTQETHVTGLVNDAEVVERVAFLLATVILLLLLRVGRALDWTFGAIMPKWGGGFPSRRVRLEQRGKRCGRSCRKQVLMGSRLIQYGMAHVNPCVGM
jgi:hypothetical protein